MLLKEINRGTSCHRISHLLTTSKIKKALCHKLKLQPISRAFMSNKPILMEELRMPNLLIQSIATIIGPNKTLLLKDLKML